MVRCGCGLLSVFDCVLIVVVILVFVRFGGMSEDLLCCVCVCFGFYDLVIFGYVDVIE